MQDKDAKLLSEAYLEKVIKKYMEGAEDWMQGNDTHWDNVTFSDVMNYLDSSNVPVEEIDPKEFERIIIQTDREQDRVQGADLQYPIIVLRSQGQYKKVLDGQHRVVKAITNKEPTIKTRVLDLDRAPEEFKEVFR